LLVCSVVGARPNFMKIAPVVLELLRRQVPHLFVHTGQHYDDSMSRVFFQELRLPAPDVHLGVGSQTHGRQTARVMEGIEEVFERHSPNLVIVGGDVNSTLATALVAAKRSIPIAHVEAGLRSSDRSMPEEINRVVTDHVSDLLFTTEESANRNLEREGLGERGVHFVGNCMVDTLLQHVDAAIAKEPWREYGLEPRGYALLTLHRPSNVDIAETLDRLLHTIGSVSTRLPVLFPVHPRTRRHLSSSPPATRGDVRLTEPLPYLTFLGLLARARIVLTDSGGVQEETTALGVPCLTLRPNTERPVTTTRGTNRLVGTDPEIILECLESVLAGHWPTGEVPPLWDGRASRRIVDIVEGFLSS
jgi:UDP-N-acetylglucosamine 2-epimerase (non-hydrolysing)